MSNEPMGIRPKQRVLAGFEPFNDIFYQNCFFNALFPVIKYFNKDIISVFVNDIIVYDLNQDNNEIPWGVKFIPVKSQEELLENFGLGMNVKRTCSDIIGEITCSLAEDRPVIIKIDCFYESIREESYLKHHWMHDLLVYGYNEPEQLCHVIEHKYRDTLSYEKQTLPFSNLIKSYNSFQENFNLTLDYITYHEFYQKDAPVKNRVDIQSSRRENIMILAGNLLSKKNEVHQSLEGLREFTGNLKLFLENKTFVVANMDKLVLMLNNIIGIKHVEKYRILKLYDQEPDIIVLLDQIIDGWNLLRSVIARNIYSKVYNPKRFTASFEKLDLIYQLEHEYYIKLLDLLLESK